MSGVRAAIDRAYALARTIEIELRSGVTNAAGTVGMVIAYALDRAALVVTVAVTIAFAVVVVVEVLS